MAERVSNGSLVPSRVPGPTSGQNKVAARSGVGNETTAMDCSFAGHRVSNGSLVPSRVPGPTSGQNKVAAGSGVGNETTAMDCSFAGHRPGQLRPDQLLDHVPRSPPF